MFTLAIGTVPSSNVPVQVLLPRRGIAAACPGALVRPLPRVLVVVAIGTVPSSNVPVQCAGPWLQ